MGVVLEAWDPDLGRSVAIKVMRPEVARQQNARQRFLREARAAAAVEHPRVVAIHHVGEWRGTPYLVMPRLRGCSLAARLKDPAPLPIDEVIAFIREAAEGLSAAHAKGLIHRDIKPGNIWLEESDQGTHVRLLDFGLARAETGEALTRSGGVVGTAHYMAPEQAAGQPLDARADLFSLGCVLYEMLTRQRAFDGPSLMAVLSALANLQPAPPRAVAASVPEWLSDLTLRLLEKNPAQRPSSADEVAGELRSLQCQQSVTALPGNLFVEPRAAGSGNSGPRARLWLWPAALTLLMLVLALVLLPRWLRDQDRNAPSAAASSGTENGLGPSGKQSQPKPEAPLQVLSVDVRHFAREQGHDVPRGVLGKQSFGATLGDKVQVSVKLSRPAYAYLIAFRPDGVADVCFPEAEDVAPPLTDEPSYPAVRSNRSYGLNEGAGLWVFAVVASEQPLPSWQEWLRERGKAAYAWQALAEAPLGQVWRDNGAGQVETLTSNGILPINRAKDQKLDGPIDAVAELTDSLLHALPQAVVTSVGFPVEPERAASGGTAGGNGF
jgi:serine/threonine protein kinase